MAKKKSDGSLGCLFIFALLIILPLVPIAWGVYALIKWFKWKKAKNKYPKKSITEFWLTQEEKEGFIESIENKIEISKRLEKIEKLIQEVYSTADEEKISRNSDNSISRKSKKGKQLNKNLDNLYKTKSDLLRLERDTLIDLNFGKQYPESKWYSLKETFSPFYASSSAFISWFIAFYGSISYFFQKPLLALFEIFDHFTLGREKFIVLRDDWTIKLIFALLISAIISIGIYYLTKYIADKFIFEKKYAKPPIVDVDNYDSY